MDAAAELGRNPVRKHQIQPEYGDEQPDVGRDCRTRLARPNHFPRSADHEQDWQPYPFDPDLYYMWWPYMYILPRTAAEVKLAQKIHTQILRAPTPSTGGSMPRCSVTPYGILLVSPMSLLSSHIKNRSDLYPVPSLSYSSRHRNEFPWSQAITQNKVRKNKIK